MEAKWTPGPWSIESETSHNGEFAIIAPDGTHPDPWNIAQTYGSVGHGEGEDEALANARLIAAAPDLAEAVRRQVENIERWRETGIPATPEESKSIYEQLLAALTRATGG